MVDLAVEIQGLSDLERALRELPVDVGARTLRSALRAAAKPMHEHMLANVPVGTVTRKVRSKRSKELVEIKPGFLKSRVKIRAQTNTGSQAATRRFGNKGVARVRVGVFRVGYVTQVEFGTSRAAAQPFIRPALSRSGEVLSIFRPLLKKKIDAAARRLNKGR